VKIGSARMRRCPRSSTVYPGANWFEREAYDLYGVPFTGHPTCAGMLTDYGFEGPSAAQGFPAHRLRRGALRRRAEARRLRPGAGLAQEFATSIPLALGRAGLSAAGRRKGEAPKGATSMDK
jgi:NADH-quinone oxidoreductase subunit C